MKTHPILFFDATEQERCKHGNVLPMPKTREQRQAERHEFNRQFAYWFAAVYIAGMMAVIAWMWMRGGR
jgi:hypothetical protein